MDIYVYSDESGVFDKAHNNFYVFGGIVFLSEDEKNNIGRKYISAEKAIRKNEKYKNYKEIKASNVTKKEKDKLFRSLNNCFKFGIIIHQEKMLDVIFKDKKSKQRFLDYAYKIGLKRFLQYLMNSGFVEANKVNNIKIYADEHTTATNGIYELSESILQEYKYGTYNWNWSVHYPPIFPNMGNVYVKYLDSAKTPLIRAADIIANKVWHAALNKKEDELSLFLVHLP